MIKGITKLFSVDSDVFFAVESISAMYIFVICILNEIISIFDPWAEITGKTLLSIQKYILHAALTSRNSSVGRVLD